MTTPYEKTFTVIADSARTNHFAIDFPHRGRITKVIVRQIGGVQAGFRFDLYNSKRPLQQFSESSDAATAEVLDETNFKIIPTQHVLGGQHLEMFPGAAGSGYEYRNVDGTYSVPQRFIYGRLDPAGTLDKTFQITIACRPAM